MWMVAPFHRPSKQSASPPSIASSLSSGTMKGAGHRKTDSIVSSGASSTVETVEKPKISDPRSYKDWSTADLPRPLKLHVLPQTCLLQILKWCDPVSIARTSRVCFALREAIFTEMERTAEIKLEPSDAFARLFIPDRRRAILERVIMEDDERPKRERGTSEQSNAPSSPGSSRGGVAIERHSGRSAQSERSNSYCTVRSLSSEHSIKDFLDTVYEKQVPTMRERLQPRKMRFEADQMVSTAEPAWAFKFDLTKWIEEYDIVEVCLQNLGNFLEREAGAMASAPSTSAGFGNPTPPRSRGNSPDQMIGGPPMVQPQQQQLQQLQQGGVMGYGMGGVGGRAPYHALSSARGEQKGTLIDRMEEEHISECVRASSGRLERLAARLAPINPLHLIFKDHSLYARRPVTLIFWFISLLRSNLRRITLDGVQSKDRLRLDGALPLNKIEQLNIIQPKENPALIVNEEILLSWLRLPAVERAPIRVRFQNCRRLSPKGMCRFIREWQTYPEVAEFESIIVDEDSMHPWELVDEAKRDIMTYESQDHFLRPRQTDLPAYATSKKEFRTDDQIEAMKRTMEFKHAKGGRAIKYYYENGLLIFACTTPSIPRPRSPLTPSSSSSTLMVGCSSHRSSIPSRPGSQPREPSGSIHTSSPLFHSYHPPPPSPGMFGRLIQILRSNA